MAEIRFTVEADEHDTNNMDLQVFDESQQSYIKFDPAKPIMYSEDDTEDSHHFSSEDKKLVVMLDKWLWAARFYKTRALAREAIVAKKISYNGCNHIKPSLEIEIGDVIKMTGRFERDNRLEKTIAVKVKGLSTRRKNNNDAQSLYEKIHIDARAPLDVTMSSPPLSHYPSFNHRFRTPQREAKPKKIVRFLRRSLANNQQNHRTGKPLEYSRTTTEEYL